MVAGAQWGPQFSLPPPQGDIFRPVIPHCQLLLLPTSCQDFLAGRTKKKNVLPEKKVTSKYYESSQSKPVELWISMSVKMGNIISSTFLST
jgi:hypothetical protein